MKTLLTIVGLACLASPAHAEVRADSFPSPSLGRDVAVAVQLPPSYGKGVQRFPVIYALHGLFEGQTFWEQRGLAAATEHLWTDGKLPEFVIICVDGGNSFFVNGPTGRYEDLVTQDLTTWAEGAYRIVPGRSGRALWGVSMGGYAALRIAFKHPEAFRAVVTHSAMLLDQPPTPEAGAGSWQLAAFYKVFGKPIDMTLWSASDPLTLSQKVDAKAAPTLHFDCGTEDRYGLYTGNKALHERLEARGIAHEFGLFPGDHGYEYVRTVFERGLRFLGKAFETGS